MKIFCPEIAWHECDAIYSVDIDPKNNENNGYIFATAGIDTIIRIWKLGNIQADIEIRLLLELKRHQKTINKLKYSSDGNYLASADDEGTVCLWQRSKDATEYIFTLASVFRPHLEDICDLAWSPNNDKLVTVSHDTDCIIWDVEKGKIFHTFKEHKDFIQGACWDPHKSFLVTLSRDRTCRIINVQTKQTLHKLLKCSLAFLGQNEKETDKNTNSLAQTHLFYDENIRTFFRRPTFSPCGSLLFVPSGCIETANKIQPVTYIFGRSNLHTPIAYLPSPIKCSSVVSCSPILYKLRNGLSSYIGLPYRIIFAIACDNALMIHDTQQLSPIYIIKDLHYWWISDLSWSKDGLILTASSTDGYVSILTFQPNELGEVYEESQIVTSPCWPETHGSIESKIESTANQNELNEVVLCEEKMVVENMSKEEQNNKLIQQNGDEKNAPICLTSQEQTIKTADGSTVKKRRITPITIQTTAL